jgi:NADPH-dependent curcumin reductase CurA
VKANFGWREYWLSNDINSKKNAISKIDSSTAPSQNFLGILGITGITAYVGLFKIGETSEEVKKPFLYLLRLEG